MLFLDIIHVLFYVKMKKMVELKEIKERVKKIVGEIVDIEDFNDTDSLTDDLGYDSIDFIQLMHDLSNEFEIEINIKIWSDFVSEIRVLATEYTDKDSKSEMWRSKFSDYELEINPDFMENIKSLSAKKDYDSISARVLGLINVNTISILLTKLLAK